MGAHFGSLEEKGTSACTPCAALFMWAAPCQGGHVDGVPELKAKEPCFHGPATN